MGSSAGVNVEQSAEPTLAIHRPREATDSGVPKCLDVFAGAGGLAVGFRLAGWKIVGANDFDPAASATFRLNFPESVFFEGSISALTAEVVLRECGIQVGELDCLIGGPPCQSFSYNNHHRSH